MHKLEQRAQATIDEAIEEPPTCDSDLYTRERMIGFAAGLRIFSTVCEEYINKLTQEQQNERNNDIDQHRAGLDSRSE